MASSPPFLMEDQTDEDFFDKLVDNEFGGVSESSPGFEDGVDSDEVNAFSNLNIEEEEEVIGTETVSKEKRVPESMLEDSVDNDILGVTDKRVPLVSSNSLNCDLTSEFGDPITRTDDIVSNGSRNTSIKEVQWSAFSATDSSQQSELRSYSDLFGDVDDNSADPFANVGDIPNPVSSDGTANVVADSTTLLSSSQNEVGEQAHEASTDNTSDVQNWENLYPGWKYDYDSGEWKQVESSDAAGKSNQGNFEEKVEDLNNNFVSDQRSDISYLQQTAQSVMGTVMENCTTSSVYNWNHVSNLNNSGYPENMVFDPQYPGWYYDTITQEWHSLESYNQNAQSIGTTHNHNIQSENALTNGFYTENNHTLYGEHEQSKSFGSQENGANIQHEDWVRNGSVGNIGQQNTTASVGFGQQNTTASVGFGQQNTTTSVGFGQQNTTTWQPETMGKSESLAGSFPQVQKTDTVYGSWDSVNNYSEQQNGTTVGTDLFGGQTGRSYSDNNNVAGFQGFVPAQQFNPPKVGYSQFSHSFQTNSQLNNYPDRNIEPTGKTASLYDEMRHGYEERGSSTGFQSSVPAHQLNQPKLEQSQHMQFSPDFHTSSQFSFASTGARSSAGRPPHALVTFGFGGKLIVMKDSSSSNSAYMTQDSVGSSISILNLMDIVIDKNNTANGVDYFQTLCQQSFPGPLVGGNFGNKELFKWIDERMSNYEPQKMDLHKSELVRLLLSLLKIACQHYGKLRSPFGTDPAMKEGESPEAAVAKLFASAKKNGAQLSGYGVVNRCLQNLPSEAQIQATAAEVQNLLVAGRTKDALQCAQEGQLWGPALVLAAQLGNQFHVDTVKQMAQHQLVAGSPLRTLCLLIAGQPADAFSASISGVPGAVSLSQQPAQIGANCMLNDWEDNLAVITSNRTKDDELVIVHLGDCLWKERGEITAAHACYLVAEANVESYSDSARMCLIGADHWKFPRTYASPDAIQRTELYEYSKVLGNSQYFLLPFQPYKLIYAYMLAELGKVSDSLKYSQAILKSIKTSRAPEVELWKQLASSLEERLKTHQQGGYSSNLAPTKLVGKLLPFIDRSIHRMIGAPPPPSSSTSSINHGNEDGKLPAGPRVANSQSTMAMSSLMPSESNESVNRLAGNNRMGMHNRSVSEPDFGRNSRQVHQSTEVSPDGQGKASISGGPSRFGRFGTQLLQKTVGWVSKSRQAKLGEKNKFYYNEELKQWMEEGAEPPSQEAAPPPPPTTSFQNGTPDYSIRSAFQSENLPANGGSEFRTISPPMEHSSGIPPIPPSSNQFSSRGRMGVRSRYVDTFNKSGGTPANLFQSPAPVPKPVTTAKFFVPAPATSATEAINNTAEERTQEASDIPNGGPPPTTSIPQDSFFSSPPPSLSSTMQRIPSMNSITPVGSQGMGSMSNSGSLPLRARRTASWGGGGINDSLTPPNMEEFKQFNNAFMPVDPSSTMAPPTRGSSFGELHEVEL